jgi:ATP-dependent Clp protease adaptor protein ClpS
VSKTKTNPREETHTRRIPPYHVILKNDDFHSAGFVVTVLTKALGCSSERAYQFMMEAHTSGRAVVWTGSKEVAELKVEQIRTFHEDPYGPLGCAIEPAPGG